MDTMTEVIGLALMIGGTFFVVVAGLGVVRLPDVPMRMHASTKAGTLGAALIASSLTFFFPGLGILARSAALVIFLLLTAPVAAHMIGRAAYYGGPQIGVRLWDETTIDQLPARQVLRSECASVGTPAFPDGVEITPVSPDREKDPADRASASAS
jgi:multicomponent Na+:H+ antiporter subunit G